MPAGTGAHHHAASGEPGAEGAIVLASGGLDSAFCLALAKKSGGPVVALGIDYGQRNRIELEYLSRLARALDCEPLIVSADMRPWCSGGLVGTAAARAAARAYVPARNLVFLAIGASVAEARGATRLYLGAGASDWHHPDCTPTFLDAFRSVLTQGLKAPPLLRTPLIGLTKAQIVLAAIRSGVPLELTWSCYLEGPTPCGTCSACALRQQTFADLQQSDSSAQPTC